MMDTLGRYYYACTTKKCQAYMWADHIAHPVPQSNIVWMPFQTEHGWKFVKTDGYKAGGWPLYNTAPLIFCCMLQTILFREELGTVGS
jgi:hypothetical protein